MAAGPSSELDAKLRAPDVFPHEPVLMEHWYYICRNPPPCLNTRLEALRYIKYEAIKGEERFATTQEFQTHRDAIRHWEVQRKYDENFFIHPIKLLILNEKHVLIFPKIIRDFNGCWVDIHANGSSYCQVKDDDMWKIFKKIGMIIVYLSSAAISRRPHGNLINGIGITSDLQVFFLNLGDNTDPQVYYNDVRDLHKLLEDVSPKLKDLAIKICVDKWMTFLSETCLKVTSLFSPIQGSAIYPPYQNHDYVRFVFNYPSSWNGEQQLQFLTNMYQVCTEKIHNNRYNNLLKNAAFRSQLIMKGNYARWNNCFVLGKNKSVVKEVYNYGASSIYLDKNSKMLNIPTIVLLVGNCFKHYRASAQYHNMTSEILDEIRKEFPHLVEDIYQAFFRAVAKGYKHSRYSAWELLTQNLGPRLCTF